MNNSKTGIGTKKPAKRRVFLIAVSLVMLAILTALAVWHPWSQPGSTISTGAMPQEGDEVITGAFSLAIRLSINELVENADAIIIGKVTDILPAREGTLGENGHEIIYTDVIVQPKRYLYGEPEAERIAVRVWGGRIGDRVMWVEDQPEFTLGESVFLFLVDLPETPDVIPEGIDPLSYYRVNGSVQGKYRYWGGILYSRYGWPTCTWQVEKRIEAIYGG